MGVPFLIFRVFEGINDGSGLVVGVLPNMVGEPYKTATISYIDATFEVEMWQSMLTDRPLILVTNDDGIVAPGLRALVEAARNFGRVVVVAPNAPQSGQGHAITIEMPIHIDRIELFEGVESYECTGTPVDCVKLATNVILKGQRIDLCLSGINHGSNAPCRRPWKPRWKESHPLVFRSTITRWMPIWVLRNTLPSASSTMCCGTGCAIRSCGTSTFPTCP